MRRDRKRSLPSDRFMKLAVASAAALLAVVIGGCSGPSFARNQPTAGSTPSLGSTASGSVPARSGSAQAAALPALGSPVDVATGLRVPWGLAFLPDGSALVGERPTGRVVRIGPDGGVSEAGTVPDVNDRGEGGLLGLAVAAGDPRMVYAYLTSIHDDNRVVRLPYRGGRVGAPTPLLTGIPAAGNHDGGGLVVGPDGALWVGTGDAGDGGRSQDRSSLGGKILRIRPDGSVPPDNPFPGSPVWSYGHRNVQGLAFDGAGQLWASEFGQNTWDELNKIVKGGNHGWPDIEGRGGREGFVEPQVVWRTDEASPSGLAIVGDVAYLGALRGQRLWRVPLVGGAAGRPVAALEGTLGRLRTVQPDPAGGLWVTTSNTDGRGSPRDDDDRVVRISIS
jgi:glucose/arabinose dehydrogenase